MIGFAAPRNATEGSARKLFLHAALLVMSCAVLLFAARLGGAQYSRFVYKQQESECLRRLQRVADAMRRYHSDHPRVPLNRVTADVLYPRYVADKSMFRCPTAQMPRVACRASGVYSSYAWVTLSPDWPYVQGRRGGDTPVLCCSRHAFTAEADGTVNVARLSGTTARYKLLLGVNALEW